MAKKKQPDIKEYYHGENNSGHYNFVIVDREIIFVTDKKGKNIPSSLNLSLEAIGLYTVLKAHAIDKNFVWPSLSSLEKLTNKTDKTLTVYLNELISKGLIIKEKAKNPRGGRERNVYVIPVVDKDELFYHTVNITLCNNQAGNSPVCKSEILPVAKSEILRCNNTNINILNELRIKAHLDLFPSGVEESFNEICTRIKGEFGSIALIDDKLIIKYPYEIEIRRDIFVLLHELSLQDQVDVIFER